MAISGNTATQGAPLIELQQLSMTFGGQRALNDISLALMPGEVHCLAGTNGCGKSTLIKAIAGVYQPDDGSRITLDGQTFGRLSPDQARAFGIQVIYQDLSLFPNLTVAENIAFEHNLRGLLGWHRPARLRRAAERQLQSLSFNLDLDKRVAELPIAQRQQVAICRALVAQARLVIMDEPTASLTRTEVNQLLRTVDYLKAQGICVVFVSHRLDEVMEVADRISVMRDGKLVGTWPASELDSHELAFLMTGQRFHYSPLPPLPPAEQAPLLEVRNLSRGEKYRNVNLALRGGEIVSIVGLLGAGRTELCLSLFGMTRPDSGEIRIEGQAVQLHNNREAVRHGIGYVSEDRLTQGLIMEQSIYDNTIVTVFDRLHTSLGLLDHAKATELVNRLIRDLNIKVSDSALPVKTLSGGNAQRIAIAKWVATQPKILILDSPTVGVDIANKEGIYQIARDLAQLGMAVLMICDEIPEAYYNSHRVMVMRKGELIAEFAPHQSTEQQIAEVVNG
ncbi:sugar ABC transporter ATP-binding protein [Serratia marcescens]|nr:sugar ABC transporter ATP-binding protein [Serratia marcescens]RTF22439.1 sugar ABC transporter ATP-binding protein [Serratia marcescens]RTF60948.1 sugar ABC transporter ATP-binding protein [Serratia marcescens]RTF82368.1 sugar ABC transporter ATP-binding protein [Serratia marcescens]RTF94447.1 sugar ABC transporter ATP-binding protein [Serratia marcescens]RTG31724.1 sugar ABC transporter ATP-binding protein [Serratia marcescens]